MGLAERSCTERVKLNTSRKAGGYFIYVMQIVGNKVVIEYMTVTGGK